MKRAGTRGQPEGGSGTFVELFNATNATNLVGYVGTLGATQFSQASAAWSDDASSSGFAPISDGRSLLSVAKMIMDRFFGHLQESCASDLLIHVPS